MISMTTFVSQMMTDLTKYAAEQEEQTGIAINVEVYNAAGSQSNARTVRSRKC